MKFQLLTLATIATTAFAINLEQVRLINDDELIVQDAQYNYPAIVNLKDEDAEVEKTTAKKDKSTSSTVIEISSSSSSASTTSTKKHDITSTSSSKHKTETASVTKTGAGETVTALVIAPVLAGVAMLW